MPIDFSGQDLRGRNFKEQDLSGADFSNSNIQGVNFTRALLQGASFTRARAGLKASSAIGIVIASFILVIFMVIALEIAGEYAGAWIVSGNAWAGTITFGIFVVLILNIHKGLETAYKMMVAAGVTATFLTLLRASIESIVRLTLGSTDGTTIVMNRAVAEAINSSFTGIGIGAVASTVAVALAVIQLAGGNIARVGTALGTFFIVVPIVIGTHIDSSTKVSVSLGILLAIVTVILGNYIAKQSLKGDERYALVLRPALALGCIGGTTFRGSNLTDANFIGAILANVDFRESIIIRTCWKNARRLSQARLNSTILSDPNVRDLLVTGHGRNKSYKGCNLKGANLTAASLKDADLTEADISNATLASAELIGANLTKTQALNTNFHSAIFTGACLEAWNIDSNTQLDNVACDYVYLFNQRERRPISGEFALGEFTRLFQGAVNTLELIFRDGINFKAFIAAFEQIKIENDDTELTVQSIENKGDGMMLVRVNVPSDTSKVDLHSEFTRNYESTLRELESRYTAELRIKEEQISLYREQNDVFTKLIDSLVRKPINVQINAVDTESMNINSSQGDFRNINVLGDSSYVNIGSVSGTVSNSINQLPESSQTNQPSIKELLIQLQAAIESSSDLSDEDKLDSLKQVDILARIGINSNQEEAKDGGRRAIQRLTEKLAALPDTAKIAEAFSKLLPSISKLIELDDSLKAENYKIISDIESYVDFKVLSGLRNLSSLYEEYVSGEDYSRAAETAKSAYLMCQEILNSLDRDKEREAYQRVTALSSYWKLNYDLYISRSHL